MAFTAISTACYIPVPRHVLAGRGQESVKEAETGPPTLTGEASDVEVVVMDADHFPFAGISAAVALDDVGAAPGTVRSLLVRNWKRKGEITV